MKYKEYVSIIDIIKTRPIRCYKYIWEDSNGKNFSEYIGPMAQDFYPPAERRLLPSGGG